MENYSYQNIYETKSTVGMLHLHKKQIGDYSYYINDRLFWLKPYLVYKGVNSKTNQKVSIKISPKAMSQIDKMQWDNQVSVIQGLDHQNILKCLQIVVSANSNDMILQTCDCNLENLLFRKKLTETEAFLFLKQIVSGYSYLRSYDYIHCNLTPKSIFIRDESVKISDFRKAFKEKQMKKVQILSECYQYYAPQNLTIHCFSQKSDIWSIGVIFYQMLTGKVPHTNKNESMANTFFNSTKKLIKPFSCNDKMWQIVQGCLEMEKDKRFNLSQLKKHISQISIEQTTINGIQQFYQNEQKQQRSDQILQNQLRFLTFYEILKEKLLKCQILQEQNNLLYLIDYQISIRIIQIQDMLKNTQFPCESQANIWREKLNNFSQRYFKKLKYHNQPYQQAIEKYFKDLPEGFDENQYLIFQSILRRSIQRIMESLKGVNAENFKNFQDVIILVDFMISALQLNAIILDNPFDKTNFSNQSYLKEICEGPVCTDYEVYSLIKQKCIDLQII